MNLDELISKYIDGELTEYEDDFLRERISADKAARKKFDDAINISIALKEDAKSIAPPIDLVERTEDIVLMKILAKAPENRRRRAFAWANVPMLAASVFALMFLMVFQISDYTFKNKSYYQNQITNKKQNEISDKTENNQTVIINKKENLGKNKKSKIVKSIANNSVKKRIIKKYVSKNFSSGASSKTVSNNEISNNIVANDEEELNISFAPTVTRDESTDLQVINSDELNKLNKNRTVFAKIENNSLNNLKNNSAYFAKGMNPIIHNSFVKNNNEVLFSSFFGTDIIRTGKNASGSVISHFSQSVAYALNKNERIGVELGYTEYAYNEKAIVNVKEKMGSLIGGVESNEAGYGFSINYKQSIVLKNSKQIIWASVFYENSFLTTNSWALIGRLGIGGTNEGPLAYGRIFTKYNLFSSFDLTLGAEGRLYSAQLPKFVGDNNKFNASSSLIYGFQFKF